MKGRIVSLLACSFFFGMGCGGTKSAGTANGDVPSPGTSDGGGATTPAPVSTGTAQPPSDAGVPSAEVDASDGGPAPNSGLPQKPGSVPGGGTPQQAPVVCSRETTGLNLAQLVPTSTVPAAFAAAWKQEAHASLAPALVLGLRGLTKGPVAGSLGPVYSVSPTTWHFESPPLTARTVLVTNDTTNPLHITIPTLPTTAITSFGDSSTRRGFTIIGFALDGTLAGQCESIFGTMRFLVPGSNADQAFGGSTVGALLGAVSVDSNADGTADSWSVDFAGTARFVNVEAAP